MNNPWVVIGMAIIILFIDLVTTGFTPTVMLGLIFFVLIGTLIPPFGIAFGAAIIAFLLLTKGSKALSKITPSTKSSGG